MNINCLKMNDSKTEFIMFISRQQLMKSTITRLNVNNTQVKVLDSIKYIGVHVNKNLNLKKRITAKCKVASFNLFCIRNILIYRAQEASTVMVLGLVVVHLDYANGLFVRLPEMDIRWLQRIQTLAVPSSSLAYHRRTVLLSASKIYTQYTLHGI